MSYCQQTLQPPGADAWAGEEGRDKAPKASTSFPKHHQFPHLFISCPTPSAFSLQPSVQPTLLLLCQKALLSFPAT